MNKKLRKWVGAYDNAKRMQQSELSEIDVFKKRMKYILVVRMKVF